MSGTVKSDDAIESYARELTAAFELLRSELPQNAISVVEEGNRRILQGWNYSVVHTKYGAGSSTLDYDDKLICAKFSAEPKKIFLVHDVKKPYALAHLQVMVQEPTRVDKILLEDIATLAMGNERSVYAALSSRDIAEFILKYAKR